MCQVVPGVNLIGMALLTGSRLAGRMGAGASVVGLVAPGVIVAFFVVMLYTRVQGTTLLQSGLHGLVAAAAAASFLNSWRLGRPVVRASASDGPAVLGMAVVVIAAGAGGLGED